MVEKPSSGQQPSVPRFLFGAEWLVVFSTCPMVTQIVIERNRYAVDTPEVSSRVFGAQVGHGIVLATSVPCDLGSGFLRPDSRNLNRFPFIAPGRFASRLSPAFQF